jgi:hypothetical protein
MEILRTEDLSKIYHGGQKVHALAQVQSQCRKPGGDYG